MTTTITTTTTTTGIEGPQNMEPQHIMKRIAIGKVASMLGCCDCYFSYCCYCCFYSIQFGINNNNSIIIVLIELYPLSPSSSLLNG